MSRGVERRRPEQRVAAAGLQPPIERLEPSEHAAHVHHRVDAVGGPAAVRRAAARLDLDHSKPLCATAMSRSVGSVTTAGIGAPAS